MTNPYAKQRLASVAALVSPVDDNSTTRIALDDIESWTGKLLDIDRTGSFATGHAFKLGNILFGKLRPYLAKVWVADRNGVYNGDFLQLSPSPLIDARYLGYALRTTQFIEAADSRSTGSKMPRTEWTSLREIHIPVPNRATQEIIANYLDHESPEIDSLICDLAAAQTLARERHAAALERVIVTDGPPPTELRRHFPERKTGTSVNGAPWPAEPGEPGVLKTGAASQREYRPYENKAVIDPIEQARLTTPVEADRVLVNRANTPSNVGAAAYVEHGSDDLFLSDKLWSIDFQGVNEYFAFAMQTRLYQDQASQRAVGTSLSMQNLPYDEFLSIRLPVPSVERQGSICATLREEQRSINTSVSDLDRAITLAKERRAALITAAVTGQIDVTAKRRPAAEQLEDDIKELS
ncbi:hypothetical protein [Brachybacterium paraconglomeratum]|uniref:hypothetical protein n=1 Tax=Brachybacterium paraconglomeratum TaxID=173362 RepID=UPI00223AE472|nr:hypothetical protein [Brachybacterium paraconglomeratum]MCT1438425.1 hypothetical protein [Brachybacterium paraconglomeratum]